MIFLTLVCIGPMMMTFAVIVVVFIVAAFWADRKGGERHPRYTPQNVSPSKKLNTMHLVRSNARYFCCCVHHSNEVVLVNITTYHHRSSQHTTSFYFDQ